MCVYVCALAFTYKYILFIEYDKPIYKYGIMLSQF